MGSAHARLIGGGDPRQPTALVSEHASSSRKTVLIASLAAFLVATLLQDGGSIQPAEASVAASEARATVGTIFSRPTLRDALRIRLHVGEDHLRLNDARDYILIFPRVKKTGVLEIRGGRNIRVIGGRISVAKPGPNIIVWDGNNARKGRVVHLEGLLIDASSGAQSDGIKIKAPRAIVQIVNCRIVGLKGSSRGLHADVIQPFGGVKALRIDGLTASSHYNGLYLRRENDPLGPKIGRIRIHHANIFGYWNGRSTSPSETIRGLAIGTQPRDPSNDGASINCDLTARIILRGVWVEPARKRPGQFVYPHDGMKRAGCPAKRSADGRSIRWPALRDYVDGAVRIGAPRDGDFVRASRVGLNYVV